MPQAQTPSWRWRQPAATPGEQLSQQRRVEAAAKPLRGSSSSLGTLEKEAVPQAGAELEMEATSGDARRTVVVVEAAGSCCGAFEGVKQQSRKTEKEAVPQPWTPSWMPQASARGSCSRGVGNSGPKLHTQGGPRRRPALARARQGRRIST